jgi:hypothetical protein
MDLAFIRLSLLRQASTGVLELFCILRMRTRSLALETTYPEMGYPFGEQRAGIPNFGASLIRAGKAEGNMLPR